MKKPFTAPFLFLLNLSLIFLLIEIVVVGNLSHASRGREIETPSPWLYFVQPIFVLLEAITYWFIRKKNRARRASWTHIILMTAGFLSPLPIGIVVRIGSFFVTKAAYPKFLSTVEFTFFGLFWALILIAHIFFIRVLLQIRSPQRSDEVPTDRHLLDDVLS